MSTHLRIELAVILAVSSLVLPTTNSAAFYQQQSSDWYAEFRGTARHLVTVAKNPDNRLLYPYKTDMNTGFIARLLMNVTKGDWLAFELNAFNLIDITSSDGSFIVPFAALGEERAPVLENRYTREHDEEGRVVVDRLNFAIRSGRLEFTLGRQAVNLATCFYFTPNDFFAPFTAQIFYRIYKPGIDAARLETRLGDLTQLTLLAVAGYRTDPESDNGYSSAMDRGRTSYLARISTVTMDFELALLGGSVYERNVIGGSLQGELLCWVGIRAEGHYSTGDDDSDDITILSVEMDHRYDNSFNPRVAWFYNGAGTNDPKDYISTIQSSPARLPYPGTNYLALGASYEFSPLLVGDGIAVFNTGDGSWQLSFNSVYSVSNEGEVSFGVSVPFGSAPDGFKVRDEYGLYPTTISFEYRTHF